jgi:beta-lactamase regulating signal transducer with metallopeptidase domain
VAAQETRPVAPAAEGAEIARVALVLAMGIWLAGGAICAARQLRRIGVHASLVRRATTAPEQLTDEVEAIARQLGLRPPRALIARGIMSPFVWFLGRLRLIWPETMSSREEIVRSRGVIAHELAHVRRGDHWVAWLELVAGLVWWWNPLFWFVRRRIRATAEMSCDAIALGRCPENRRGYAELLLELSAGPKTGALAAVLGVSASASSSFERRLSMILSDRVSGKVSGWGLLTAGLLAVVALPGWSLAQEQPPHDGVLSGVVDERLSTDGLELDVVQVPPPKATESTATPVDAASPTESTAARLQKLEAEIQRLSRLLEQPQQTVLSRIHVSDRLPLDILARVHHHGSPIDAATPVVIMGRGRTYILAGAEKGAYLTALNTDGRQIWLSHFPAPLPIRGDEVTWTVEEPTDRKQVILTWTKPNERIRFCFDTNSGQVLTEDRAHADGAVQHTASADPRLSMASLYGTELRLPSGAADGRALTESQNARLERLEKAVDDLRKRLEHLTPSHALPDGAQGARRE